MGRCAICGSSDESHDRLADEIFLIDGKYVLVDGIPAKVCPRCGYETFSRQTAERIRLLVRGEARPTESITVDVFEFAQ